MTSWTQVTLNGPAPSIHTLTRLDFYMKIADALLIIDSLRTTVCDDPTGMEAGFSSRKVMVLVHVLERNFDASPELNHGLAHGRWFAAEHRPGLALSRLYSTLLNIKEA
jgi:hypothetical protein